MDTAGEGSSKKGKRKKEAAKKRPARKRPAQSRKSSVSQLIQRLRHIVFPNPSAQSTKQQVLQRTKIYIQELEKTLDSLLKMRDQFAEDQSAPCSLEDVKEEYLQSWCDGHSEGAALPSSSRTPERGSQFSDLQMGDFEVDDTLEELYSDNPETPEPLCCPDLVEFERYLHFYRQMMDTLNQSGLVTPSQSAEPEVSKAIINIWQDLKLEHSATLHQHPVPVAHSTPCSLTPQPELTCSNGSTTRDNSAGSQGATSSFLSSTPEEILIDDAFEIATCFLDQSANPTPCSPSSPPCESPPLILPDEDLYLYQQVYAFLKFRLCSYTQPPPPLNYDYETVLLRCTETFNDDEEDDL